MKVVCHALKVSSAMEPHKDASLWQCLVTPTRIGLDILRNKKLIIVSIIYFLYYFYSDGVDGVTTSFSAFSTTFSTETAAASTLR